MHIDKIKLVEQENHQHMIHGDFFIFSYYLLPTKNTEMNFVKQYTTRFIFLSSLEY